MAVTSDLVQLLKDGEVVSPDALERAVAVCGGTGESVASWLVTHDLIAEDDLFFLMSRQLAISTIPEERLLHLTLTPEVRRRVPRELAEACALLPLDLDIERDRLSVAMFDPVDSRALERLRHVAGVSEVNVYLARRSVILKTIGVVYAADEHVPRHDESAMGDTRVMRTPRPVPSDGPTTGDLEEIETGVEVIPGKVSLDPALAREIAAAATPAPRSPAGGPPTPPPRSDTGDARQGRITQRIPLAEARAARQHAAALLDSGPIAEAPVASEFATEGATMRLAVLGETGPVDGLVGQGFDDDPLATDGGEPSRRESEIQALLWELLSGVGVLVSMLEERIDPGSASSRECSQLSRAVARELGVDPLSVARIALAAHLYGLDTALRQELGGGPRQDIATVFELTPSVPGGLNPTLRALGARALGISAERDHPPAGVALIRLVADYLELRAQRSDSPSDSKEIAELLQARCAEQPMLDALIRAVEHSEQRTASTGRFERTATVGEMDQSGGKD